MEKKIHDELNEILLHTDKGTKGWYTLRKYLEDNPPIDEVIVGDLWESKWQTMCNNDIFDTGDVIKVISLPEIGDIDQSFVFTRVFNGVDQNWFCSCNKYQFYQDFMKVEQNEKE